MATVSGLMTSDTSENKKVKKNKFIEDALILGDGLLSFGEDFLKLIPTPFATEIRDSLLRIVTLVRSTKENKKYCNDLLNRLTCATETIGMVLKYAPAGYDIGPKNLRRYVNILGDTQSWVEHFNEPTVTRKFLNLLTAEKIAKEISELKQDMDSVVIDMTYHIVATTRDSSMSIIDQSEWEIAALLSGAEPSGALISRIFINDNDIHVDTKNNQRRGSRNHVIKKILRHEPVAEKSILPFKEVDEKKDFWKEVAIAEYLRDSPHIAKFRGINIRNDCFYTYYEWAEMGDLNSYLTDSKHSNLDWQIKIKLAYEISCALSYCHSKNILHHSVKGHNILLDEFLRPLLSNFQHSRQLTEKKKLLSTSFINTGGPNDDVRWTAPEKLTVTKSESKDLISKDVRFTKECDVFSFGMLMYEIASQSLPFSHEGDLMRIRDNIKLGKRPYFASDVPKEYREIVEQAWNHDPDKRPTMSQITEKLYNLYTPHGDIIGNINNVKNPTGVIHVRQPVDDKLDINKAEELHEEGKFSDAFPIFQRLEQNGNKEARYYVGYYLYKGEEYTGMPKNLDHALDYLEPVAKTGHADAQYYTAIIYYEKYKECKESVNANVEDYIGLHKQFLDMAVKQNHLDAIYTYGQHRYIGKYYAKDKIIGNNMLMAAHYLGHKDAKARLYELKVNESSDAALKK